MEFTAVESTYIAAVSHDAAGEILVIRFRDGRHALIEHVSSALYAEFMAAPSKGVFYHRRLAFHASAKPEPAPSRYLDTFGEDPCCSRRLQKAGLAGSLETAEAWTCPRCDTLWKPRIEGELRIWEAHPYMVKFNGR